MIRVFVFLLLGFRISPIVVALVVVRQPQWSSNKRTTRMMSTTPRLFVTKPNRVEETNSDDVQRPTVSILESHQQQKALLRETLEKARYVMNGITSLQDDDTTNPEPSTSTHDDARMRMMMITIKDLFHRQQWVKVAPSSIPSAGRGLFAECDIPVGTMIGLYPVHGLGIDFGDSSLLLGMDPTDQEYFDSDEATNAYQHYVIGSRPLGGLVEKATALLGTDATIYLNANPNKEVVIPWTGHLVNDGAVVHENNEDSIVEYYRRSRQAKNCVCVPFGPSPFMAAVTTRDVAQGEEFFTSYGCSYWIEQLGDGGEEISEVTAQIQAEVQETAKDLFRIYQLVQTKYAKESSAFQSMFSALKVG